MTIATLPFMPGPDTVSIAKSCKLDSAFTGSDETLSLLKVSEPCALGLRVFLISHGTPALAQGKIVLGCSTLTQSKKAPSLLYKIKNQL